MRARACSIPSTASPSSCSAFSWRSLSWAPYRSPNADGIPAVLIDPEYFWTGFSARIRVIAYNTNLVKAADAPRSVLELADPRWKGRIAIADPRFGSTSFHVAALYALVGDTQMDDFFRRLKANSVRVVMRSEWSSEMYPAFSDTHLLIYQIEANAFLQHMVRRIVGMLVTVGRGATVLSRTG